MFVLEGNKRARKRERERESEWREREWEKKKGARKNINFVVTSKQQKNVTFFIFSLKTFTIHLPLYRLPEEVKMRRQLLRITSGGFNAESKGVERGEAGEPSYNPSLYTVFLQSQPQRINP